MMVSTLVFLLAALILSLTDARRRPFNCQGSNVKARINKFRRLNRSEEEARADRLYPKWRTGCVTSAWELSNKVEGDLLYTNREQMRQAIRDKDRKWKTKIIPYHIQEFYYTKKEVKEIHEAMKEFSRLTCAELREFKEGDIDHIDILGGYDGCSSFVGRQGGAQTITLEPPVCLARRGNIYHVLMHALGFLHEHNSAVRDNYVTIITENIAQGKKEYLDKYDFANVTDIGFDYDYDSIMHGSRKFLTGNNRSTIVTKDEFASIGHKQQLSEIDIQKVNQHLGCKQLIPKD